MPKRRSCPNCGYVAASNDPVGTCIQCVQRARHATARATGLPDGTSPLLERVLLYLHDRKDGWFRVVSSEGDASYFKWKFTSGPWEGSYILYVIPKGGDTLRGYEGLVSHLAEVDNGTRKPSPDKPY